MEFQLTHQSRIFEPGPFGQCHASTVVRLAGGRYLAAWFGGTKEGASDVSIHGAVREPVGEWSPPVQWARVCDSPHWNPVLFAPRDGTVMLFFKEGPRCDRWRTWVTRSLDSGGSWEAPVEVVPGDVGGRGPVKNKPVVLSDGSWLAPNSLEDGGRWRVLTDRSADGGRTWSAGPEVAMDGAVVSGEGAIQPTLWESAPGCVHMLTRSSCGFICRSDSGDYGSTWSQLEPTSLPNNNSGIDLDRSPDGAILLAYNRVSKNWGPRTPLSLAVSSDNGATWKDACDLETAAGEYSYPAVIATPEGFAGTYTWKRASIVFWEGRLEAGAGETHGSSSR